MKFKIWEKVYWGLIVFLFILMLGGIAMNKGDIKVVNRVFNQTTITYISKGKAVLYITLFWLGFWGLIWLIVKALTGGFSSK